MLCWWPLQSSKTLTPSHPRPSLHSPPFTLGIHFLSLSPVLTPLQPLCLLCCHSVHQALGLCTDYSSCLKHSSNISLTYSLVCFNFCSDVPSYESLSWKPYLRLQSTSVNNQVPLILPYSLPLWSTAISNIPFNSLIRYMYCLRPVFHHWNSSSMKTRIFVSFVHSWTTSTQTWHVTGALKMCWNLNEWWVRKRARI